MNYDLLWFTGAHSVSKEKLKECTRAAGYLKKLLERDIKPRYAQIGREIASLI